MSNLLPCPVCEMKRLVPSEWKFLVCPDCLEEKKAAEMARLGDVYMSRDLYDALRKLDALTEDE